MALRSLPSNLETAYDRILASLEPPSGSVLLQVLQWLAHSYLPLKHEEVIDIISTNSEDSAESAAATYRFITPVLSRFVIYSNNGQKIRLHACAKEYFTSEAILLGPSAIYGFSEADAHATIARCCLKYLMRFGGTRILTPEDKDTNQLLEYAARFWYRHSRAASQLSPHSANARILHEIATEFFDSQNKPSFHNWLRVSRPDHAASNNPRGQDMSNLFGRERLDLFGNALYYAATCGLTSLVSNFIQAGQSARTEAEHIDGCRYPGPLEAAVEEGYTDIAEILLEADARPNTWTQLGGTCLLRACRQGDVNMAQVLIQYGAKVNAWLSDGSTTLHCAAKYGSADLIDLLVEHGAEIDARSNVGTTPLLEALLGGKVDSALALLRKGANIEAATEKSMRTDRGGGLFDLLAITNEQDSEASREIQDSTQRTPLYVAVSENNIVVAQELVARGARVDALTSSGATSLFAATHAGLVEMIKFLLRHKASTKIRTHSGATLLHAAAESGKPEVVELMFAHKIDPTVKDDWQDTALMRAVSRSGVEVVRAFANHGCDLREIKQVSGMTLLHFAALSGKLDTVAFLLERGLDVHARNLQGGTPLHIAANAGHTDVMELLLRSGADINATFVQNWTPLRAAIMGEAKKAIISLLKQVPPPNLEIKDKDGYTVLQIAVHKGNAEITELLLQNGADPNSQTNEGVTALMTAADNMVRLVPTLLKFGARVDIEVIPGFNALARPVLKDDSALVEMLMEGQKDREALFVALEINSINGRIIDLNDIDTLSWALVEGREVCTWMILRYGSFTPNTPLKFSDAEAAYPPLMFAVQFGHLNIVKLLLRLGVDIETCTRALYVTATVGQADIMEALLDYGVSVDGYNDSEITPLMSALENRHDDVVRLLCKRGANLAAEEEKLNLSVVIGPKQVFYGIRHQR
jgi:ankyrin repeat protein